MQATRFIEERFSIYPLAEKWLGLGWNVVEIDGHNVSVILDAYDEATDTKGKPAVITVNTSKGNRISFAEKEASFHSGSLAEEQYDLALAELSNEMAMLSNTK